MEVPQNHPNQTILVLKLQTIWGSPILRTPQMDKSNLVYRTFASPLELEFCKQKPSRVMSGREKSCTVGYIYISQCFLVTSIFGNWALVPAFSGTKTAAMNQNPCPGISMLFLHPQRIQKDPKGVVLHQMRLTSPQKVPH